MADTTDKKVIKKEVDLPQVTTIADTDLVRMVVDGKSVSMKRSDFVSSMREALIGTSTEVQDLSGTPKLAMIDSNKKGQLITPNNLIAALNKAAAEDDNPAASKLVKMCDTNGVESKVPISNLASVVSGLLNTNMMQDGVFVIFHRNSDNYPLMVKPYKWPYYQSSGEIADGVAIVEGGHILVVAPTESPTTLLWSSAAITGGGTNTGDRVAAMNDWNGKANTAAQIAASTANAITNTAGYAPGFCNLYSRKNSKGAGLTAGKWWLPSVSEWMMVYANKQKVNYALSLISGATQLVESWYWTSTENSSSNAWLLTLLDGHLNNWNPKASFSGHVRAVSTFIL